MRPWTGSSGRTSADPYGPSSSSSDYADGVEARTPSDDELLRLSEAAADLGAPDRGQLTALLKSHADDVERTLGRFLDDDPEAALRLAAALPMLWQDLGRLDDGRSYTEQAIARWSGPQTPALAMAFVAAAELAFRQGDQ